ncbi:TetR/AcrR family transcriptional regulator C-terminal domain-containing protein [Streptomyces sp. ITFR-16]|uniref:TetR/AcrR family transcriptional regulator n=1 Tax=Streptomyces sp. ITFR-16 TaxID=3075198 RepID=UPI00288A3C30|nr:TetR/AcrR family transcriptional regulator C-terminal domain-containing protein [Streptomyces sp. ITFR-16]WNI26932.1 TetR/AcrR family transcriptional regulator C-terminal domain-containing protein [Streptomyces sp. ITFR-16]
MGKAGSGGAGQRFAGGGGTGLPASIEAAWGLRARSAKGPRPGLSLERIVDAAVAVAAAEGLGAVSMGRVAKDLGASTMSLYRYVAAKDELFVLMREAAMGPPPPPAALADGAGWREALGEWAWAQRRVLHRHLWMLRIPLAGPPVSPNSVAWWEQGLQALEGAGLDPGEQVSVILLVSGFVRNEALVTGDIDAAVAARGIPVQQVMEGYAHTLSRLVDPVRHPTLSRLVAHEPVWSADAPEHEFRFGLERVLDGIDALIRARGQIGGTERASGGALKSG